MSVRLTALLVTLKQRLVVMADKHGRLSDGRRVDKCDCFRQRSAFGKSISSIAARNHVRN
jgi:hypothetical protein